MRIGVSFGYGESQMGDPRRSRDRHAGPSVEFLVENRPEFVIAHVPSYAKLRVEGQWGQRANEEFSGCGTGEGPT